MIAVLAVVGTVVPFIDELVFRGLLFAWLRGRMGLAPAVLISAFCFALLQGVPQLIPAVMALGIVLALVVHLSRSVWSAIIVHASFNAAWTLLLYAELATQSLGG
jgi:membrane protease YdiL (CAAX protease family)